MVSGMKRIQEWMLSKISGEKTVKHQFSIQIHIVENIYKLGMPF